MLQLVVWKWNILPLLWRSYIHFIPYRCLFDSNCMPFDLKDGENSERSLEFREDGLSTCTHPAGQIHSKRSRAEYNIIETARSRLL